MNLARIKTQWDALAAPQLRAEIQRLEAELQAMTARAERAEVECARLEDIADGWREDAFAAIQADGLHVGITQNGHLVGVGVAP
jgi:predicted nuclease with TOPRIM domain